MGRIVDVGGGVSGVGAAVVGKGVGHDVGVCVGPGLGLAVGADEGADTGTIVGPGLGLIVGTAEGAGEGTIVGAGEGEVDGRTVGPGDGCGLGSGVGGVDGVELNVGCPQQCARKGRYGAFMMDDPDALVETVRLLSNTLRRCGTSSSRRASAGIRRRAFSLGTTQ